MRMLILFLALILPCTPLAGQTREVDFRYAPASWFSALCYPGDWQKSVVTHRGALGDDFAPGPYAHPLTEITFGAKGHPLRTDSVLFDDPRIPIARALLRDETVTIEQKIFALIPSGSQTPARLFLGGRLERLDALTGSPAWASPPAGVDEAFRGTAWGVNRPVKYRVKVEPGSKHQVVLGLCDPYKPSPGKRVLILRVEGAGDAIADPVRDGKPNTPYIYSFAARDIDNNGWIQIEAHAAMDSPDPNVILNAIWVFENGFRLDPDALVHGRQTASAEIYWRCGTELDAQPDILREDALLSSFPGDMITPTLIIHTRRPLEFDSATGTLLTAGRRYIRCIPSPVSFERIQDTTILEFPQGATEIAAIVEHGAATGTKEPTMASLHAALDTARIFWERHSNLPFGSIVVPESRVQGLLDASIRNLYSISEIVEGTPQFQPGPSVYRGLWVHDALWQITAALFLGDTMRTRCSIEALLGLQQQTGQIEVMAPYPMNRETPISLFLACRYARLTNDRAWLEGHWHAIRRGVRWLWNLRQSTLTNPRTSSYGLFPPGFADGGLGGLTPEYGSVYWGLVGLSSTASAARWLGRTSDAVQWEAQFRELLGTFRNAAARDQRADRFGNPYLPMMVGDTSTATPPQKANWGILDAQGLGNIFSLDDTLVNGTLRMLRGETVEGLPPNTGWLKDGLWPFFGTLEALAHLYQREDSIAAELLYAIANHASPTGTWVEEQLPRTLGTRTTGDASNATASALFIKLIRRMLILERDSTLELLAGIPPEWYRAGAHFEVREIPTLYGRCTFRLDVARDDSRITVIVRPLRNGASEGIGVLHLENLQRAGFTVRQGRAAPRTVHFPPAKGVRLVLTRPH